MSKKKACSHDQATPIEFIVKDHATRYCANCGVTLSEEFIGEVPPHPYPPGTVVLILPESEDASLSMLEHDYAFYVIYVTEEMDAARGRTAVVLDVEQDCDPNYRAFYRYELRDLEDPDNSGVSGYMWPSPIIRFVRGPNDEA